MVPPHFCHQEKRQVEKSITSRTETTCLTEKQTDYVYKIVEEGNIINTKTVMYKKEQNQGDNPYKKVALNKVFREEDKPLEMRNWSIFSDNVRYIQQEPETPPDLNFDTLDYRQHKELYFKLKGEERETLDIDFGIYPDILKSKYLDVYESVYAEMVYANTFNENSDLSTMYLGQTKNDKRHKNQSRRMISYYWSRICIRKIIGQYSMSNFVGHRCHKVLHVKILLFVMQISTCITKIFF